jgi:hydroxysqualene synthase
VIHRIGDRRAPVQAVPMPHTLELDACYRYCESLCHAHRQNYPVASFFARSHLRKHIWAIFAFARVADDIADESAYEGRRTRELDRWESDLQSTYFGNPPEHPVFIALADTAAKFSLPITEFTQLISGLRTDLDVHRYATWSELFGYTRQAAEPVGHLLLYVGGYRAPELHAFADDLSSGLAIARLIQDMPADLARGRVYVPAEDLRHFGVTEADIEGRRATPQVGSLVRYLVARTRALFVRARPLVEIVSADLSVEMALMWHGGARILDKIEAAGDHLFAQRPGMGTADKALVVTRALAWRGTTLGPRAKDLIARTLGD